MNALVVDASVSASWLFDDEYDDASLRALNALETTQGIVPRLWHFEMRNILLVATRRNRITRDGAADRIAALTELPLETDDAADLDRAMAIAEQHTLSYYDALYLELAVRRGAGLATLDKRLREASSKESVLVV